MPPNSVQVNPKIDPVMNFLKQAVLIKHGDKVDQNFIDQETSKIYDDFGSGILNHFKPMISADQQEQLNKLIDESQNQEIILGFLMESIENFEQKIIQYLVEFKDTYIAEKLNK